MKVTAEIETKDKAIIKKLKPIVDIVNGYKGHINKAYWGWTGHNSTNLCTEDNAHKANILNAIKPHTDPFIVGTGAGHIWVAIPNTKERVLLITDK